MAPRPHWLLDHRAGWRDAELSPTLEVDDCGRLSLRHRPDSGRPLVDAAGSFGGFARPTGLTVDRDGRVYVLDRGTHQVARYDTCSCRFEILPCLGGPGSEPRQLRDPRGLLITCDGDLIVADTGNHRLQVFALKGLTLRRIQGPYRVRRGQGEVRLEPISGSGEFPDGTWEPWDLAPAGDGGFWVSDPANGLIHRFDRRGGWRGALGDTGGEPLVLPTHLAVDGEARLYVVEEGREGVAVFDRNGRFLERVLRSFEVEGRFFPTGLAIAPDGTLYLSCKGMACGESVYRYRRQRSGGYCGCGSPLQGSGRIVAFDADGNPLAVDGSEVLLLSPSAAFETDGRFVSEPLDSRIYRCPWHRVAVEAEVPAGTRVTVETFTSESPKSSAEIAALPDARWALGAELTRAEGGEWDCLVKSVRGRYLWLRLSFAGDGTATPEVDRVRVEYPRASSLRNLPAVYQEDVESRDFLDRFLSIFDTLAEAIGDEIGTIARIFDPRATPEGFLPWLASWLGLSLDRNWPEEKRRHLISEAHRLYALRGTPEGLRLHVRLYTGFEPRILEHFALRRWFHVGSARLGDCAELWGDDLVRRLQLDVSSRIGAFQLIDSGDPTSDPIRHQAHRFTVFVPWRGDVGDEQRRTLERIVEMAKPAHTEGAVVMVEPLLRLGVQSRVGVDTVVGRYPEGVVAGDTELGRGSVLGPSEDQSTAPTFTVGVRSRIGSSSLID